MSKVTDICGDYPNGFVKIDVGNNPNYVFINDPLFPGVKVWDVENNSVFVNSFEECEHYVSGGWTYNPTENKDTFYQNSLGLILIFFLIGQYLYKRYKTKMSFLYE
tara:strand:+ start:2457 stop:2774 length:318 start_codon:yes stop_codon:yes gene_type:complete